MPHTTQSSFTLLELLIVIAIIAILAATVMVSLSSTRQSAWEARGMQFSQNIKTTLADSLVGEWSFDDQSNPGRDDSGNGNNGAIYKSSAGGTCTGYPNPQSGCPQLVNGKVRGALSFDGVDDYVDVPDSSIFSSIREEITVEFWMKPMSPITLTNVMKYRLWGFYQYNDNTIQFAFWSGGSYSGRLSGTFPFISKQWNHIVGVVKSEGTSKRAQIYINGKFGNQSGLSSGSIDIGTDPFRIGYVVDWGNRYFNGLIDEVRIYNRALTAYEIKALYAEGKMRHLADR